MTREAPELRSSLDLPPPLSRQDAGFLQRRVAQAPWVVTHRRLMLFEADPAAPPPPPPPSPPPELPEDDVDYAEALPEAAGGDPTAAGGSRTRDGAEESGRTREGKADGEADDDASMRTPRQSSSGGLARVPRGEPDAGRPCRA